MDDATFYQKLLDYIEEMEWNMDAEYGFCRSIQELTSSNLMPDIHKEVIRRLFISKEKLDASNQNTSSLPENSG